MPVAELSIKESNFFMRPKKLSHFVFVLAANLAFCSATLWPQQTPRQTTQGLKAADGMEVTLWASEPDIVNPTNIDIDARGRVWVLEGVNYRRTLPGMIGKDDRPAGDRIVILEDTDGDGRSDKTKVFAQDLSLRTPLGIAVLGDRVIVSQSPDLIVFTKDAQDNIVKKEVLLTGWRGVDHDHGLHAVTFGPDGRFKLNIPSPIVVFEGLGVANSAPPDNEGAVGPNDYVALSKRWRTVFRYELHEPVPLFADCDPILLPWALLDEDAFGTVEDVQMRSCGACPAITGKVRISYRRLNR